MLSKQFISHLENLLSETIVEITQLAGGDINEVYRLWTNNKKVVIKLNSATTFPGMFEAEARGLQELKQSNTFTVPNVLNVGQHNNQSFLVLEYIATGKQARDFWTVFGRQLALLHKQSKPFFGFEDHNYIGSLHQYNAFCNSAVEFYITQRLQPQFELASKKGFSFENLDSFYVNIENEIPNEVSSLIHGDLWSGNFIIDSEGYPCLIDPAVAYAPREMDIAIMHLFGGFDQELFEIYNETFPLTENWKERISLWQLYYLLVHLNLFGSSYHKGITDILDRYT